MLPSLCRDTQKIRQIAAKGGKGRLTEIVAELNWSGAVDGGVRFDDPKDLHELRFELSVDVANVYLSAAQSESQGSLFRTLRY